MLKLPLSSILDKKETSLRKYIICISNLQTPCLCGVTPSILYNKYTINVYILKLFLTMIILLDKLMKIN